MTLWEGKTVGWVVVIEHEDHFERDLVVQTGIGPFDMHISAERYAAAVDPGEFPAATATVIPMIHPRELK